jgi:uncharacterized protein (DUF927 family)
MYLAEGIDRGRGKAYGGLEVLKEWNCCFLFTGEEPITKSNSGGGVKNRVIEIEATSQIIFDGNHTSNFVRENYGHAGKEFIENLPDKKKLQEEYRKLLQELIAKFNTTSKQAMAMAAILVADKVSTELIFGDEPLKIEDVKGYMASINEVDPAERAYEIILDWIDQNKNRFSETSQNEIWGKIQDDCCFINKLVLEEFLKNQGIDFNAIKKSLADTGKIERDCSGYYTQSTRINGNVGRYVKVILKQCIKNSLEDPFDCN